VNGGRKNKMIELDTSEPNNDEDIRQKVLDIWGNSKGFRATELIDLTLKFKNELIERQNKESLCHKTS